MMMFKYTNILLSITHENVHYIMYVLISRHSHPESCMTDGGSLEDLSVYT